MKVYCEKCQKVIGECTPETYDQYMDSHIFDVHTFNKAAPSPEKGEGWLEKTAAFFTFEEMGDEVIGKLEKVDSIDLHDHKVNRAHVRTETGGLVSFLLSAQLDPLMLDIPLGMEIRVRYEGEAKSSKGRMVKKFRVWTR